MDKSAPSWKDKHYEMLCRIDDICRQCDINMLLCDGSALASYINGELSDYVSIAIEPKDAYKFIEEIERDEKLEVRGMFNYKEYPLFDLKVYNPGTVDFNIRNYKRFGFSNLYVTVEFIQHTPNVKIIAKNWERAKALYRGHIRVNYHEGDAKNKFRLAIYRYIRKFAKSRNLGREFFDKLVNRYSRVSKRITLGRSIFDRELFNNKTEVSVRGRQFFIPGTGSEYLEERFGENWHDQSSRDYIENEFRFRDADHNWENYKDFIEYLDFSDYFENTRMLNSYKQEYRKWNRRFVYDKRILKRTHLRFVFWQKYMPMKGELIELHKSGDYEKLSEILKPYTEELKKHFKYGMTVFFDRDIFEISKDVLRETGSPEIADAIENYIPEEHKEPIRIKNYQGEYI